MKHKSLLTSILGSLIVIPLVSAIDGPLDFFMNDWIKFALVFAILFAVMFNFFKPRFNYNAAPAAVVSTGLAILLAMPIMQRGILEAFISPKILDWVVLIAIIIAVLFLLFWFWKKLRFWGIFILIIGLGILAFFFEDYIPETLMYGPVGTFVEWVQGLSIFIPVVLVIIVIIVFIWRVFVMRGFARRDARLTWKAKTKGELQAKQQAELARATQRTQQKARIPVNVKQKYPETGRPPITDPRRMLPPGKG